MGSSWTIVTAGILTLLISQNVDVIVFHRLKSETGGRHLWLRNVFSTGFSQFVDTVIFIYLGFMLFPALVGGSPQPADVAIGLIGGQYAIKVAVALLDTPLFYAGTFLGRRWTAVELG